MAKYQIHKSYRSAISVAASIIVLFSCSFFMPTPSKFFHDSKISESDIVTIFNQAPLVITEIDGVLLPSPVMRDVVFTINPGNHSIKGFEYSPPTKSCNYITGTHLKFGTCVYLSERVGSNVTVNFNVSPRGIYIIDAGHISGQSNFSVVRFF